MKVNSLVKFITQALSFFIIVSCASNTETPDKSVSSLVGQPELEPINIDSQVHIITNWDSPIVFLGYVDTYVDVDDAKGILYSGDAGAAGLLVQIFAHAAISNSVQKKKAAAKQVEANKVLMPYDSVMHKVTHKSLFDYSMISSMGQGFNVVDAQQESSVLPGEVAVKLTPRFYLAPDQRAIMMRMDINAYQVSAQNKSLYTRSIKVISKQIEAESVEDEWLGGVPSQFENTVHGLFDEGLEFLISDFLSVKSKDESVYKTYSFQFGDHWRYERAIQVREACDRLYLKDLKKNFVIIPKVSSCEAESVPLILEAKLLDAETIDDVTHSLK